MKFIRKNGRIIPIREKSDKASTGDKALKIIGTGYAAAGAAAIAGGAARAASGLTIARSQLKHMAKFASAGAVQGPFSIANQMAEMHKASAAYGFKKAASGGKIALAGAGLLGLGLLMRKMRMQKK